MTPTNPTTSPMDDLADDWQLGDLVPKAETDAQLATLLRSIADHLQLDCLNRAAERLEALRSPIASREEEVERATRAIYENGPYMVPWDALDPDFEDDRAMLDGCRSDARAALASIPPGSDYRRGVEQGLKDAAHIAISRSNYGHVEGNKRAFKIAADIEDRIPPAIEGLIGKGEN